MIILTQTSSHLSQRLLPETVGGLSITFIIQDSSKIWEIFGSEFWSGCWQLIKWSHVCVIPWPSNLYCRHYYGTLQEQLVRPISLLSPALPCATKPLNVVLPVQTFHLNSRHHLCSLSIGGIQQHDICYKTLSGIKGDGRVLTSGTISGGSYGVSATRQLATTKLLRHNNISEPGKLNSPQSVRERERALFVFPWLKWAVWVVTSLGRGAAVSQPTFHLFCQQQELTTTSNWDTKTFQSFSHNACPVQSPISFPFFSFWKLSQRL